MLNKDMFGGKFIRSLDFPDNFEDFFISAIAAILGIRIFLHFASYPQFGGKSLHIAHMLWGGALMLIAIIIALRYLDQSTKKITAIIGGLGFGVFIDELGKFITSNNNYFYQPTFALIYLIFILLYVTFYELDRKQRLTSQEYLINSLEFLKQAAVGDLDHDERTYALRLLTKANKDDVLTQQLSSIYDRVETIAPTKPNWASRLKKGLKNLYIELINKKWFKTGLNILFIVQFLISSLVVVTSVLVLVSLVTTRGISLKDLADNTLDLLNLFASAFAGVFVILGVYKMRESRLAAYKMFRKSMLIFIFLVQVFSFYEQQLNAFTGLLFDIFILITLNYMINKERILAKNISHVG